MNTTLVPPLTTCEPSGLIEPLPPETLEVTVNVFGTNVATQVLALVIVTVVTGFALPGHAPLQPEKSWFAFGVAVSVTVGCTSPS